MTDLKELRALEAAATPGEWFANGYSAVYATTEDGENDAEVCFVPPTAGDTSTGRHNADMWLIPALRNNAGTLLNIVEAARELSESMDGSIAIDNTVCAITRRTLREALAALEGKTDGG